MAPLEDRALRMAIASREKCALPGHPYFPRVRPTRGGMAAGARCPSRRRKWGSQRVRQADGRVDTSRPFRAIRDCVRPVEDWLRPRT